MTKSQSWTIKVFTGYRVQHYIGRGPAKGGVRFHPGVTLDEINRVAKDWAGGSRVVLVSAPQKAGLTLPDGAKLTALIKNAATRDLVAHVDVGSTQPLLEKVPEPGRVVTTLTSGAFEVTEWILSNGVKVVLKPTDFKQDEVMFRATSPGGTSLASDRDYVAATTASHTMASPTINRDHNRPSDSRAPAPSVP